MTSPQVEHTALVDMVVRLLRRNATKKLGRVIAGLRPADIARAFRRIAPAKWTQLFELVADDERAAEVLTELDREILTSFLEQLTDQRLVELLPEMESDDAADVLELLSEERAAAIVAATSGDEEDLSEVAELLRFDPETAGGLMTPDVFALPARMTAGDAIAEIQHRSDELEMVFYLYVVNEHGHLVGVASLRELVIMQPEVELGDLMTTDVLRVATSTDQEEVARIVARYNLLAVPVVDESNRLVGVVTVDDIIDVIREEATEDILKMAGVPDVDVSDRSHIFESAKSRIPWLFASFLGGVMAVFVIGAFDEALDALPALAAFIPITLGMGGNVGTQSATLVTRGLALGQIDTSRLRKVMTREIGVGVLCGLVYGLFMGLVVSWYTDFAEPLRLAATVGLTILVSMTVAALVGGSVPIVFQKLNIDPAIASGPFVTTSVDVLGIGSYFLIAQWILGV